MNFHSIFAIACCSSNRRVKRNFSILAIKITLHSWNHLSIANHLFAKKLNYKYPSKMRIHLSKLQSIGGRIVRNNAKSSLFQSASSRSKLASVSRSLIYNTQKSCMSSQSSLDDPEKTLFHTNRRYISESDDLDKELRSDVKSMGSMLGKISRFWLLQMP